MGHKYCFEGTFLPIIGILDTHQSRLVRPLSVGKEIPNHDLHTLIYRKHIAYSHLGMRISSAQQRAESAQVVQQRDRRSAHKTIGS